MKIILIWIDTNGNEITREDRDLSLIKEIPNVADEVIGNFYSGLVHRRTFNYKYGIVKLYIRI